MNEFYQIFKELKLIPLKLFQKIKMRELSQIHFFLLAGG